RGAVAAARARPPRPSAVTRPPGEPTPGREPPGTHRTRALSAPVTRTRGGAAGTRSVDHGRPTTQRIHAVSIVTKASTNPTPATAASHARARPRPSRERSAPQNTSERTAAGRARIGVSV